MRWLLLFVAACSSTPSAAITDEPDASTGSSTTKPGAPTSPAPPTNDAGTDSGAMTPTDNGFPNHWIDGTACATDPDIQVWSFTKDTHILRQSLCTNFEGPFIYVLVGQTKALMIDTGTGDVDLRPEVTKLVGSLPLVVAHSHSHGDHTGGDGSFKGKPNTTVVGTTTAQAHSFFGLTGNEPVEFDLGGRIVDVMAIPGHQAAHLAFYDRETKILLTGDTLYPGRLYIDDWNAYRASVPRLAAFVANNHPVSWVLGAHIELPKTGNDFPQGSTQHPNEHPLPLLPSTLTELSAAVQAMGTTPKRQVHTDFIIDP